DSPGRSRPRLASSIIERLVRQPDVEAQVHVAEHLQQVARGRAALARPVVALHADRQAGLPGGIHHGAVAVELPAGAVGVDRLDADAAALVVLVLGDADLRPVQPALGVPALGEALDHVADAGLGDGVPAVLQRPRVARVDGHEPDGPADAGGVHAHHAVVAAGDVGHLLAGELLGARPAHVDAERLA